MDNKHWDQRYAEGARAGTVWGREPNRWLVAEVDDLPAGRALDLAAGEGRNTLWLAERGWQVLAVDFSSVGLQTGQRLAKQLAEHTGQPIDERITWVYADLLEYTPEPAGFDLVLIAYLHLPAPARRAVLRKAAEALAPGGTLLVLGHHASNLAGGYGGPRDPDVLFTAEDVLADLGDIAALGLAVVRAEPVRRPVTTDDGQREAIDVLVRLRRAEDRA